MRQLFQEKGAQRKKYKNSEQRLLWKMGAGNHSSHNCAFHNACKCYTIQQLSMQIPSCTALTARLWCAEKKSKSIQGNLNAYVCPDRDHILI
jgi:hypothetical protein